MRLIFFSILLSFSSTLLAGIQQAPQNFEIKTGLAVWVDFLQATYDLEYNAKTKKTYVITTIDFIMPDGGYPLFDSVATPSKILLNGNNVDQNEVTTPDNASKVRMLTEYVSSGQHTMTIYTQLKSGVKYRKKGISSGLFILDLKDRNFLEKYVPTNYEFDQYKMTFNVQVNSKKWHNIFANGTVTELGKNKFQVNYPEYFTSSSVFFHLVPLSKYKRTYFNFSSIDGREIPVVIYSNFWIRNKRFKKKALKVLRELEADYGPWPHPSITIYGTKLRGGMEYAGATASSLVSLGHELQHSYFAKGIFPANGNSGWMDEAIASWRDEGHQSHAFPNYESCNLANHSPYTRKTDDRSYAKGRSFIAYLDFLLKSVGKSGMKDFLRQYFNKRQYTTVTTADFKQDLEEYSGLSLTTDFARYIYGMDEDLTDGAHNESEHHPQYTQEEIDQII